MRLIASLALSLLLLSSCVVLWRSPWNYAAQDRLSISAAQSTAHPAGTDALGRDRAVRLAAALLLGMAGAFAASVLASTLAVGIGTAAAFAPAWVAQVVLYAGDLFLTLPWLFLLMMVRAALPLNLAPVLSATLTFFLLGLLGVPLFLRVHYARTRSLRQGEWMLQSRAAGLRPAQIARQLLPHLRPVLLLQILLYIPACLTAEANLGALGLGVSEPLPSWGSMLQEMQGAAFLDNSHWTYVPLALLVFVLSLCEFLLFRPKGIQG